MGHSVTISWKASADPVAGYAVYRITLAPTSLAVTFNRLTPGLITALIYTDTEVQAGYTYIYFTTAWTSIRGLMSQPSNVVSVTIPSSSVPVTSGVTQIEAEIQS
jgi:hypothetical protein